MSEKHLCVICVCVPCVAAPAPGQSAETAAAACGAGLSALLPPSWQMTNPREASKCTWRGGGGVYLNVIQITYYKNKFTVHGCFYDYLKT